LSYFYFHYPLVSFDIMICTVSKCAPELKSKSSVIFYAIWEFICLIKIKLLKKKKKEIIERFPSEDNTRFFWLLIKLQFPAKTQFVDKDSLQYCRIERDMGWFWWPRLPSFIPINYMASNLINNNNKGWIEVVKKSSRQVIERYYSRMTLDFHTNKKALEEVAIIPSKRPRNKIAGFSTHLMKQIQKGPVRGISLKLQEEESERPMDFVPEVSAIKSDQIEVDKEQWRSLIEGVNY